MSESEEKSEFEELSAWLDKEDNNLSEEQINSEENKEAAEDFKKIDSALLKISSAPQAPADLIAKIAEKCNEKPQPINFSRHLWRIVAVLAACLVISFIYKNEEKKKENIVEIQDNEKKSTPVISSADPEKEKEIQALRGNPNEASPSEDFTLVGTNSNEAAAKLISLGDEVQHVWVSENPEETAMLLQKLAGSVNSLNNEVDAKGNIKLSINITDTELIKVVNSLNDNGNDLISKELPQPNQITNLRASGKMIRYSVSIVRKK